MSDAAPRMPKPKASDWLAYAVYRGMEGVLGCLPLTAVCAIGRACGHLGFAFAGKYRRLVIRNLRIATAHENPGEAELRQLARETFARAGANLFGSLRSALMTSEALSRHIVMEGRELLDRPDIVNDGCVVVWSHMGNWEMMAQLVPLFRKPGGTIYRPLTNPLIDALVRKRRESQGAVTFGRTAGFHGPAGFIRNGGALSVLSDQRAGGAGEVCPFFGRLSNCSPLPALLARRAGGQIVTLSITTTGLAQWRLRVRLLPEKAGTPEIMAGLETAMRDSLTDVFWFHDRWRTDRTRPLSFYIKTIKEAQARAASVPMRVLLTLPEGQPDASAIIGRMLEHRPDLRIDVLHRGHTLPDDPRVHDAGANQTGGTAHELLQRIDAAAPGALDAAILLDGDAALAEAAKAFGLRAIIGIGASGKPWTKTHQQPTDADGWRAIADELAGVTRCVP